jgi:RNA polymerase sigma factor (sigma-70 family)
MEQLRNSYDVLPPYAITTIRIHAHRLARDEVIRGMAAADFEQELALDLWRRLPAFDPRRASLATFIDRIVRNRVTGFHKAARAGARRLEREAPHTPLDELDQAVERSRDRPLADIDRIALRHDLARFVAALPSALRRCCAIVTSESTGEAIRKHGLHPSTYYEGLRRLRQRAREVGLHEYRA